MPIEVLTECPHMPESIANTAQTSEGGAGLLQWQVETVLLWVPPAPPSVTYSLAYIYRFIWA